MIFVGITISKTIGGAGRTIPLVSKAILKFLGTHPVSFDSDHSIEGETIIQRALAALLMAGLSIILYFLSRLFLHVEWNILVVFSNIL